MAFKSWFDSWSPLVTMILTLVGWMVVSWSNRSNNRLAALLATKNQARIEISAALKQYLDYLHELENPAAAIFDAIRLDQLDTRRDPSTSRVLEALKQLENRSRHDPRLGVGGLEILKGYLPLFPDWEEAVVDIQLSQYPIEKDLDDYFERTKQLIREGLPWRIVPTDVPGERVVSGFPRTDEEKSKIWSQISIVNNFVEHLTYTVMKDLTKTRRHWIWTGNREYFSHLDSVGARLWSDRRDNPHVSRWEKDESQLGVQPLEDETARSKPDSDRR